MEVECERWGEDEEVEMDVDLSPELMEELLVQISSAREMLTFSTSVDVFNVSSNSIPFLYAVSRMCGYILICCSTLFVKLHHTHNLYFIYICFGSDLLSCLYTLFALLMHINACTHAVY